MPLASEITACRAAPAACQFKLTLLKAITGFGCMTRTIRPYGMRLGRNDARTAVTVARTQMHLNIDRRVERSCDAFCSSTGAIWVNATIRPINVARRANRVTIYTGCFLYAINRRPRGEDSKDAGRDCDYSIFDDFHVFSFVMLVYVAFP